ncbi:MBL fold metallo-hydrolase [Paenibacillus harenae]|uniref:Phosphoribosyl 1,2-cyclic phosphate phosphodiesterase n=1 Tax=Paenibacillus harenae TaxID=306543 RepID=A0ABT9TZG2_PAEHA|nr:MBL fold metallo-hydrolase [Paenibacillus harenae]MDQ0112771.1 phosphoribosyl 1,2-cyclic phosphate phosphodiesterase [Paenibacillus harenae]
MDIHFLGTAAAEGFPAMFCRCGYCLTARRLGGPNIRTRSSVILDGVLKIDFPPDTLHHVLRDGIDLGLVKDLFVTHTHLDHLRAEDLEMRLSVFAHGLDYPLQVYGHDAVIRKCRDAVGRPDEQRLILNRIVPFETVDTGTAKVTALPANHDPDETCLLYCIEKDGKRVFYGHDTGLLPEETWEWLERTTVDLAILDCTNGNLPYTGGHLNIEAVIEIRDRLRTNGVLHDGSRVVATHFSHNIGLLHDDLTAIFDQEQIIVAYDGLILSI